MPTEVDPRGPLPVALKVDGLTPGQTAFATIAGVDVGILNLTGYASPDPEDHYFGQRKLGMGIRDVYGRLIDGVNKAGIEIDRKVLSDMAIHEAAAFTAVCDAAKKALAYLKDTTPNAFESAVH